MTNQYIEQLDEKVQAAVFGNVGTLICFRVGPTDAEILEKEFTPKFTVEDLINIAKYNIYIKLMIDGIASDPFSARGLPPLSTLEGNAEKIIRVSRERYSRPRAEIEDKIARWASNNPEAADEKTNIIERETTASGFKGEPRQANSKPKARASHGSFEAICSYCGATTQTSFEPDGVRPVFCKDCLLKMKNKDLIIERNHKGEYIVIKEPGNDKDNGLSLNEIKDNEIDAKKVKPIEPTPIKEQIPKPKIEPKKPELKKPEKNNILRPGQKIEF